MRERENSLAMGLGVHDGRRVRDLVGWGLRTERESVVAGSGVELRERGFGSGEEREILTTDDILFFFFHY